MIITGIKLQNFKKFRNLEITLSRGINVIEGRNEAGKSTIANALLEAFFTDPATAMQKFAGNYSWSGNKEMRIAVSFTHNDANFLLVKDFARKTVELQNQDSGKSISTHKEVVQAVAEITGIPSRAIYSATACISQSDIAAIQTDEDFISALQNVAGTGDLQVNVQSLIKQLENERKRLRVGLDHPAKYPGPIKQVQEKISGLQAELKEKQEQFAQVSESLEINKDADEQKKQLEEKIDRLETMLANNKKLEEARIKLDRIKAEILKLQARLTALQEKNLESKKIVAELQEQYKNFRAYDKQQLEESTVKITGMQEQIRLVRQELQEHEKLTATKDTGLPKLNLAVAAGAAVVLILASLAIGILVKNLTFSFLGTTFAVILAVVIVVLKVHERNLKRGAAIFAKDLMQKKKELQAKISALDGQLSGFLQKFAVDSVGEFFTSKAKFISLSETLRELSAEIKGILGDSTFEGIQKEQIKLLAAQKEIEVNELTEDVKLSALPGPEILAKKRELALLLEQQEDLNLRLTEAQVRVSDSKVTGDDLVTLEEQLELAKNSLEYHENLEKVYGLTVYGLQEAVKETAQNANKLVSAEIKNYLPLLTGNRYHNARLTRQMDIEVFSREKDDWVEPIGVLSKGTVDQIYFLARIAFVKILIGNKTIPLILDDPFVTFDSERRSAARKILEDLAKDLQIILFTYSGDYRDWGKVIKLGA